MNQLIPVYLLPILIGMLSGVLSSLIFLLIISRIRPRIAISKEIAQKHELNKPTIPAYTIKVINRSRRSAIDVRAELHLITPTQVPGGSLLTTNNITLRRPGLLELPRFNKKDTGANYAFRFETHEELDKVWNDDNNSYMRFSIYAKDDLSGFSEVFTQCFYTKRDSLKHGDFTVGDSFKIR